MCLIVETKENLFLFETFQKLQAVVKNYQNSVVSNWEREVFIVKRYIGQGHKLWLPVPPFVSVSDCYCKSEQLTKQRSLLPHRRNPFWIKKRKIKTLAYCCSCSNNFRNNHCGLTIIFVSGRRPKLEGLKTVLGIRLRQNRELLSSSLPLKFRSALTDEPPQLKFLLAKGLRNYSVYLWVILRDTPWKPRFKARDWMSTADVSCVELHGKLFLEQISKSFFVPGHPAIEKRIELLTSALAHRIRKCITF